ncbi:hypothetical protein GCM10022295_42520 [Streptomyces osmaniensis]|uniref:Uncharacterized protein n=1 Tax=Streptomyces osmaniensis TaxID=593134 RepID=A0ABP6WVG6_9ACTN
MREENGHEASLTGPCNHFFWDRVFGCPAVTYGTSGARVRFAGRCQCSLRDWAHPSEVGITKE